MTMKRMRIRAATVRTAVTTAVIAGAVLFAGCAAEPTVTAPSPTPTATPTPASATPKSEEEGIAGALEATRELHRMWDEITIAGDGDTSRLDGLVVGEARDYIDSMVASSVSRGIRMESGSMAFELIPDGYTEAFELPDHHGVFGAATLFGCTDSSGLEMYDAAGERITGGVSVAIVVARFDVAEQSWTIEGYEPRAAQEGECAG